MKKHRERTTDGYRKVIVPSFMILKNQKKVEDTEDGPQITLNIGGTLFDVSKSTLTSVEGSYFYAMLASD